MFCALLSVERFFLLFRAIFSATPSTFLSVEHFFLLFRALFFVIPSESEESSMDASLRLRSVQHDKRGVIPSTFLSFRAKRGIHCGFFIQMQKFFQMKVQFR